MLVVDIDELGDGKSHYIRKELEGKCKGTIVISEIFKPKYGGGENVLRYAVLVVDIDELGDGKSHYIRKELEGKCKGTIVISEIFKPKYAIERFREHGVQDCALHFNITLLLSNVSY